MLESNPRTAFMEDGRTFHLRDPSGSFFVCGGTVLLSLIVKNSSGRRTEQEAPSLSDRRWRGWTLRRTDQGGLGWMEYGRLHVASSVSAPRNKPEFLCFVRTFTGGHRGPQTTSTTQHHPTHKKRTSTAPNETEWNTNHDHGRRTTERRNSTEYTP